MENYLHFTQHARQRMAERNIYYHEVAYTVRYGDVAYSGEDFVYVLHDIRRFTGLYVPGRLIALAQKKPLIFVVLTSNHLVKTVGWRYRGKKQRHALRDKSANGKI